MCYAKSAVRSYARYPQRVQGEFERLVLLAKELDDTVDFYDKCRVIARNNLDPKQKEIRDSLQAFYAAGWSENT